MFPYKGMVNITAMLSIILTRGLIMVVIEEDRIGIGINETNRNSLILTDHPRSFTH